MKTKLLLLLIVGITLASCSKETKVEKFAVKVALELGSGKYKEGITGINLERWELWDKDYLSRENIYRLQHESLENFIKDYKAEDFIEFNAIFSECKVLSIQSSTTDLFSINNKKRVGSYKLDDFYEDFKKITFEQIPEEDIKIWKIEDEEIGFSFISKKNVPLYIVKMLIDNKYIYTMMVIDNPDKGLQVTLFGRTG